MLPEQSRFQNTVFAVRRRRRHDGQLPVRSGFLHLRGVHPTIVHVEGLSLQAHLPRALAVRCRVWPPQRCLQEPLLRATEAVSRPTVMTSH